MAARRTAPGDDGPLALKTFRQSGMDGLRIVVALVFCYAGWAKLRNPQAFADSIASFQLLPAPLIGPLALALPFFELGTGIWIVSHWKARTGVFCGLAASVIFFLALVSALARGLAVECGCFGGETSSSLTPLTRLWLAIGRDALLVGALAVLYCQKRGRLPGRL